MIPFERLNFYERLGVRPDASRAEIQGVYDELVKLYVADQRLHGPVGAKRRRKSKVFLLITEAYRTLSSTRDRSRYDRRLRMSSSGSRAAAPSRVPRRRVARRRPRSCFYVMALSLLPRPNHKRRAATISATVRRVRRSYPALPPPSPVEAAGAVAPVSEVD